MSGCFIGFEIDLIKVFASFISISFAAALLLMLKKVQLSNKSKIMVIYAHLTLLLFPLFLFTTNALCGTMCMPCYNDTALLIAYTLPTTLLFSTFAGFIVIPSFYILASKKKLNSNKISVFVKKISNKLKIKTPNIYIVDSAKPFAFSFRSFKSAIFLSVGLFDIMKKKEIEAIILHEFYHIKNKSSALKFSTALMRLFSPLSVIARFKDTGEEEISADRFAIKTQGTSKYINSAKKKMERFF